MVLSVLVFLSTQSILPLGMLSQQEKEGVHWVYIAANLGSVVFDK